MKAYLAAATCVAIACGTAAAAEEVRSGLQPGAVPAAFDVKDCTGPAKGYYLCYRCRYGGKPVVSIFARNIDDNLVGLIKKVDETVGKNEGRDMRAFVVLLSDKPEQAEQKLVSLAQKNNIHMPLTVYDGYSGPPEYRIAEKADITVIMWDQSDVKVTHAFAKGKLDKTAISQIVKDTTKILN